jgi:hypothetical protein
LYFAVAVASVSLRAKISDKSFAARARLLSAKGRKHENALSHRLTATLSFSICQTRLFPGSRLISSASSACEMFMTAKGKLFKLNETRALAEKSFLLTCFARKKSKRRI